MVSTLRQRHAVHEEGLTPIERRSRRHGRELIIGVLIVAVVVGIGIAAISGGKGTANNGSAQSVLRKALAAEKTYFANSHSLFSSSNPTTNLTAVEAGITWSAATSVGVAGANLPTSKTVIAMLPTGTNGALGTAVLLVARSAAGDCFYIFDETSNSASTDVVGTSYFRDPKCSSTTSETLPTAAVAMLPNTSTGLGWATKF